VAYADRVQETTTTTGTGTVTLAGAVSDFQAFQTAFPTGTRVFYAIAGGTDWEVGSGTLVTATTLSRDVVYGSSNAGALVNLAAGSKSVFCDLPAVAIADIATVAKFAAGQVNQ
jgi:hypothetical protein